MKKLLITLALAGCFSAGVNAADRPMRILLVNDDGCKSPGTVSLQEKLAAKGYDVWMVAPATNQSGIGSAITFKPNKIFDVKQLVKQRFCFPGTPADSVDFALLGLLKDNPPDLVISGVNDGPNTGAAQMNSGTLSAAARALRYGYPSIAASIGYIMTTEEMKAGWPSTKKYWPESVNYVVTLVDKLHGKWQPGTPVLPGGIGLSINYPALPESAIKGIKYVGNEQHPTPQFSYKILSDGRAQQIMSEASSKKTDSDTDSGWLDKGYITWTVFDGSWNAPEHEGALRKLLP
ncbi:5'/3'-nucleotidase SurE [Izhakiella australiensis]|uniref:5'-nucleotidase n=1 Tax=Izhakiella australiensis TaxID=1926881 RepID=A0A1S8Y9U0_9GAMM|nr:5'/3'-nucleotidase SurE [Izhakiella australiensis]OON35675.1 5'/3'-nucleotidase SurE [Izhakiella australiensis]